MGAMEVLAQIQEAESYKQKGNDRVKEGDFKKALGAYHRVFCYVNGLQIPGDKSNQAASYAGMLEPGKASGPQVPPEKLDDVKKLKTSTRLNMALCYLKTSQHAKCIEACTTVLEADPSAKAYFR